MSYLESRLNQIEENIQLPAKEGGLQALAGKKFSELFGYRIHTIPLFHHSFFLLKQSVENNSYLIIDKVKQGCQNKCQVDLEMTYGANFKSDYAMPKCQEQCISEVVSPFLNTSKVTFSY
jgi:hypothetical protein